MVSISQDEPAKVRIAAGGLVSGSVATGAQAIPKLRVASGGLVRGRVASGSAEEDAE